MTILYIIEAVKIQRVVAVGQEAVLAVGQEAEVLILQQVVLMQPFAI